MNHFWTSLIALGVIFIFGIVYLFVHRSSLAKIAHKEWFLLVTELQKRQDILPNLIENLRKNTEGQNALLEELINMRAMAAHEQKPGIQKFELEMSLSAEIAKALGLVREFPILQKDTNFLEISENLRAKEKQIEIQVESYNRAIRTYNRFVKFLPWRKRKQIYEFESATGMSAGR